MSTPTGNMFYFSGAARSFTFWKYTDETSNTASDKDIMKNNYMFVMLSNLSVISHLIFLQYFFLFFFLSLDQNLKITKEAT